MKKTLNYLWLLVLAPFLMGAVTGHDPTQPPGVSGGEATSPTTGQPLSLTAIFVYPDTNVAIINGQAVKEGDRLGEYIITTINRDNVELIGSQNERDHLQLLIPVKESAAAKGY
jgi:hypothetical protein